MKPAIAPQVMRQAAEWLVRLDHGSDADAQTEQQFRAWLAADPQHHEAITRLQGHIAPLQELPARAALRRAQPPRRRASGVKGLALLAVLLAADAAAAAGCADGHCPATGSAGRS